ncbi:FAD-dependent monooxygenase, partial [Streptomyces tendae]
MDPVIVAGAGPVGLTLALALARLEVPVILLDESTEAEEGRLARTVVLRPDAAALLERLGCRVTARTRPWTGWRTMRRRQLVRQVPLTPGALFGGSPSSERGTGGWDGGLTEAMEAPEGDGPSPEDESAPVSAPSPLHLPQHELTRALRGSLAAMGDEDLVRIVSGTRIDDLEQDDRGVGVRTRGAQATWWRGSYLVGCDGPRSTVRKLLGVRFPGRTAVERHAVAALRAELPWPGEALLHRSPPWRSIDAEVTARPLPHGLWRIDWLLPPGRDLVTPDALMVRVRDTLAGWCGESEPPYELLDTGVHTVHHRLALRWRVGRAFLAGDAAHL